MLADGEAALLLADLASQRLLLEILELQLVEDAANLDAKGGVLIVAVLVWSRNATNSTAL